MTNHNTLPIEVTREQAASYHIITGLAQRAFQAANFDMTPENAVEKAFELGYLVEAEQ